MRLAPKHDCAEPEPEDGEKDEASNHRDRLQCLKGLERGEQAADRKKGDADEKQERQPHRHPATENDELRTGEEKAEEEENVREGDLAACSEGEEADEQDAAVVEAARNGKLLIDRVVGSRGLRARQPSPQDPGVFGEGLAPKGEEEASRQSDGEDDSHRRCDCDGQSAEDGDDDHAECNQPPLNVRVPWDGGEPSSRPGRPRARAIGEKYENQEQ